jgi:hypothetical protein
MFCVMDLVNKELQCVLHVFYHDGVMVVVTCDRQW